MRTDQKIREILVAAKVDESDLDWMIASCPSVARALEVYPTGSVARTPIDLPPREDYAEIMAAREVCIIARESGDARQLSDALAALTAAVDAFKLAHPQVTR